VTFAGTLDDFVRSLADHAPKAHAGRKRTKQTS
jgi:hypothetical protein